MYVYLFKHVYIYISLSVESDRAYKVRAVLYMRKLLHGRFLLDACHSSLPYVAPLFSLRLVISSVTIGFQRCHKRCYINVQNITLNVRYIFNFDVVTDIYRVHR